MNRNPIRTGKRRIVASLSILAAIAAVPTASVHARTAADNFDGVWRVSVVPDNAGASLGKQSFSDEILFENGQMSAAAVAAYGFAPAEYVVSAAGSTFTTTMVCEGETIVWTASVGANGFVGNVTWTKPGGECYQYTLRGVRFNANEDEPDIVGGEQ